MPHRSRPTTRRVPALVRLLRAAAGPEALSAGRALVGVAMLVRPGLLTTALAPDPAVDPAAAGRTTWVVQMLGAREVGLGLGALHALRSRSGRRGAAGWLAAGLLADGVDAVALAAAIGRGQVGRYAGGAVVAVAAGAAAVQAAALGQR